MSAPTQTLSQPTPAEAAADLRLERRLGAARGVGAAQGASFARAERIEGELEESNTLIGNAELRTDGSVLRGDRITYTNRTDEITIDGNARFFREGGVFSGPELRFKVDAQTGAMPSANFSYAPINARGSAGLLEFVSPEQTRLTDAMFTTCSPGDKSWWVQAEKLEIDRTEELARARGARLYFKEVPIFASPYFQFPLGDQRRTGILTPSFGLNSRLGPETTIPIYWNIAPNRDLTVAPRIMARRGVLLQNEFRYLEPTFRGAVEYDGINKDRDFGDSRERFSLRHEYAGRAGVAAGVNYNSVSDDRYFSDFGTNIVTASQSVLPREGFVSYTQPYWNSALRVTKNQTLRDPLINFAKPYERVPQFTLNAQRADVAGFDIAIANEATRFENAYTLSSDASVRTDLESGTRLITNPSISYPYLSPGGFLIPKVQWHSTRYQLDEKRRPLAPNRIRNLTISSLDAGLVFERDSSWFGDAAVQTVEPRLFYSYVPYKDQSDLPNFDSALADFNFAQLFNENVFVGGDRIGEANQLTAALVSRILDGATGAERFRAAIGQRYYFSPQRVTLPGGAPRDSNSSDLLFGLSGMIARHWVTDVALQHSTLENQVVRATMGLRYQPRAASVLSLAYRYKVDELQQIDFSGQWPITQRWYGVGRANFSFRDDRWVEVLGGFEYKADCWVLRFAAHRFATAAQTNTTQVFFAIELNGLGAVGTSPVEQLRRNIPGYQVINPPPREPGRFDYYE